MPRTKDEHDGQDGRGAAALEDERASAAATRATVLTDGVVAIALTLLALDLKPNLPRSTDSRELAHYLHEHASAYAAFAIAFALIAQFWLAHHRLMHTVRRATPRLVVLTFLFLFGITLAPLTTDLTGEYSNPLATTLFALNLMVISTALFLMGEEVRSRSLDDGTESPEQRFSRRVRAGVNVLIPGLVIAGGWLFGGHAEWLYLLYFAADEPAKLTRRLLAWRS